MWTEAYAFCVDRAYGRPPRLQPVAFCYGAPQNTRSTTTRALRVTRR
jgi:hypothetical protein